MLDAGQIVGIVFGILIVVGILVAFFFSIRIVPQTHFYIVERLGTYKATWTNGLHFLIPFLDRAIIKGNVKEKVLDFPAQDVITKDNATIKVDTVVYMQITDPKLYAYGAENPIKAIDNLSATTLRNLLGELELDETLTSRETVNTKLALILDEASDSWGIKVHRVELKNIIPPREIMTSMEKQTRAEREKRANILDAEGFKQAAILEAEGRREARVLEARGRKESLVLEAEGQKRATVLNAEGQKESIHLILSAKLNEKVLLWQGLQQLGVLANGRATKIIIPPNLTKVASVMAAGGSILKESFDKADDTPLPEEEKFTPKSIQNDDTSLSKSLKDLIDETKNK